jgi:hypothetical protein
MSDFGVILSTIEQEGSVFYFMRLNQDENSFKRIQELVGYSSTRGIVH